MINESHYQFFFVCFLPLSILDQRWKNNIQGSVSQIVTVYRIKKVKFKAEEMS